MRTREWRRYKIEVLVKRRLKKFHSNSWWGFQTPNGDKIKDHIWVDQIGSSESFFYKSHTSKGYLKASKYSPNNTYSYHRDPKPKGDSLGTRELDKRQLLKLLKEYGLR